jgi:hypothetical protein
MTFRSSMTLFIGPPDEDILLRRIDKYFAGVLDHATTAKLEAAIRAIESIGHCVAKIRCLCY